VLHCSNKENSSRKRRNQVSATVNDFDVAIIGMAGRFPGAKDTNSFWENLKAGKEGISFFSEEDMEVPIDPADLRNPNFVRAKGVLADIDLFDASFFNISAREAEWMDPQQRLFLECAWQALENAGYDSFSYPHPISVYAGVNTNTYLLTRLLQLQAGDPATYFRVMLSNEKDHLATRVSYKLNLCGESITVQTSCSTSLVAVHLAYQSVLTGQSAMALAGGISIQIPQKTGYFYQEGLVGSPDGHCRPFDAKANGTVPGHGVGVVVLKLLADAVKDGDTVLAVIKGSAINNDGHNKVGYTAPSVDGQTQVISRALAMSGVHPEQISFVEAHGTGTPLGDPIEVEALTRAFRKHTDRKNYCVLGAVKSMIGHLDNAAGVAGLIKVILALQHKVIPPTLHFERPNPMLRLESSPFRVTNTPVNWTTQANARYAGVSGFGIGGTNVHMVLGEPPVRTSQFSRRPQIVTLCAKSASALKQVASELMLHMQQNPELNPADVAYTRNVGRRHFDFRAYVVGKAGQEIVAALNAIVHRSQAQFHPASAVHPKLAFLFPGQGSYQPAMMREIYETEREFRSHVDFCFDFVREQFGLDLFISLYGSNGTAPSTSDEIARPEVALPILFSLEYALARLWMHWGLTPQALFGHSFGEYVAATLAGIFSLRDGLWLATMRGRLMQQMAPGAMTAVRFSAEQLDPLLSGNAVIAAVNSRNDCTISGPIPDIEETEKHLREQHIGFRRMDVPYAFHSSMVDSILGAFQGLFDNMMLNPPTVPLVSSLTGTWLEARQAVTPEYWLRQMRETVQFAPGLNCLKQSSLNVCLEIGFGQSLSSLVKQHQGKDGMTAIPSLGTLQAKSGDAVAIASAVGQLWQTGLAVDWDHFYEHEKCHRIPLPTYPFECKRYWIDLVVPENLPRGAVQPLPSDLSATDGKAKNLPLQDLNTSTASMTVASPPRNELEQVLVTLWREVLGNSELGIGDAFFDLGADSLTASQACARLKQLLLVDVTLEQVLSASTVEELSLAIQTEVKRQAGLEFTEVEPSYYCVFKFALGNDDATVFMTEDEFKQSGIPQGATELTFVPALTSLQSIPLQ
jgi:acyl transferase domain-containing protein